MIRYKTKRIYDIADEADGYRVLVDRLWPRGVSKERAALDAWAKQLAPSTELRRWFNHDPGKFSEFATRYRDELDRNQEAESVVGGWESHKVVTLLFGARDVEHNEAVVLCEWLANTR